MFNETSNRETNVTRSEITSIFKLYNGNKTGKIICK